MPNIIQEDNEIGHSESIPNNQGLVKIITQYMM